jgi:hypothetical protein
MGLISSQLLGRGQQLARHHALRVIAACRSGKRPDSDWVALGQILRWLRA